MEENENKDTINTEDANITTEPKFNKKKVIIISSIAGAVVIIGLMILLIFGAINKGKEIVEGVGSISNSIGDTIDKVANAEPITPEPTTPEETTEPETTTPEIETIDPTADPFTAVVEDLPEAVISDILAKMESEGDFGISVGTTTGGSNTAAQKPTKVTIVEPPIETQTQKPTEQETTTQAPKEDKGGTFNTSTGKLTLWGEDMIYYEQYINGQKQVIPWEDYKEQIKTVEIKDGMKEICDSAFSGCTNLQTITIPNSVTTIGDSAFRYCTNLQTITIPNSVTTIGEYAFVDCANLKSINIPEGVATINRGTFSRCISLTNITLPSTLKTIEEWAFVACENLETIDIPDNVSTLGRGAFAECRKLKAIDIPRKVTYIPDQAFFGCYGLTEVTIPGWVETVETCAFNGCHNITSFVFSEGVKTIGCIRFVLGEEPVDTSVYIPASVTTITSEDEIYGYENYYGFSSNATLYVIKGSVAENYLIEHNYQLGISYYYYEEQ